MIEFQLGHAKQGENREPPKKKKKKKNRGVENLAAGPNATKRGRGQLSYEMTGKGDVWDNRTKILELFAPQKERKRDARNWRTKSL